MSEGRLKRLRAVLAERELAAFVVTSPESIRYFSGFRGGEGGLLIGGDSQIVYTDSRYIEQAGKEAQGWQVIKAERSGGQTLSGGIKALGDKARVGFESGKVTVAQLERWKKVSGQTDFVPCESLLEEIRSVKEPHEIDNLKRAAAIADRAFRHMLTMIVPGVSERDVALELDYFMRRNGAEGSAFETIIAFGENTSLPHAIAGDRMAEQGDFVLMDFGAVVDGYHSDMTRTFVLGDPTPEQDRIYDAVYAAQTAALDAVRPGIEGREADAVARDILKDRGYGDYFGHGLGHGIGLEIHELPVLSPLGKTVLAEGMTVTVEPGVYVPGFGGVRIEDSVVVTASGCERLTLSDKSSSPKDY